MGGLALDHIPVFVLEVDAYPLRGGAFLHTVAARARRDGLLHLRVVDVSRDLSAKHFFRLDDHLNASGHQMIAGRLSREIGTAMVHGLQRRSSSCLLLMYRVTPRPS